MSLFKFVFVNSGQKRAAPVSNDGPPQSEKDQQTVYQLSLEHTLHQSQEASQASADLFHDVHERPITLSDIMQELKALRCSVDREEAKLQDGTGTNVFRVQNSVYKSRFRIFLKGQFTKDPWLNLEDEVFKAEVRRILRKEGHGGDSAAVGNMCSFATTNYTYYRNNLKRTLITKKLQHVSLKELSVVLLKPYLPPGESPLDSDRVNLVTALRSFLHSKAFYRGATDESLHSFWDEFKALWTQLQSTVNPRKWEILKEAEERRIKRHRERVATEQTRTE